MSLAGLRLISATPESRMNDHFRYRSVYRVVAEIHRTVGNPEEEETLGLYGQTEERLPPEIGPMQDLRPLNWSRKNNPQTLPKKKEPETWEDGIVIEEEGFEAVVPQEEKNLQNKIEKLKRNPIIINEVG